MRDKVYAGKDDSFFENKYNQADRVLYSYAESVKPVNMSGQLGLGVDIRRFMIEVGYEKNLSRFSKSLALNNVRYSLLQDFALWKLSVGFKLNKLN